MMKKTLKLVTVLSIVLCASTAVGYSAFRYFLTDNTNSAETVYTQGEPETAAVSANSGTLSDSSAESPQEFDYYVARLDGNIINIYISDGGHEEFLYGIDVYVKDIPYNDVKMLSEGVKLYSKQALTSFEEDFTS